MDLDSLASETRARICNKIFFDEIRIVFLFSVFVFPFFVALAFLLSLFQQQKHDVVSVRTPYSAVLLLNGGGLTSLRSVLHPKNKNPTEEEWMDGAAQRLWQPTSCCRPAGRPGTRPPSHATNIIFSSLKCHFLLPPTLPSLNNVHIPIDR
jgi:hypothetical protein